MECFECIPDELILRICNLDLLIIPFANSCKRFKAIASHLVTKDIKNKFVNNALMARYFDVATWGKKNGYHVYKMICENAALYGRLDILKWAKDNNCPWCEKSCASAAGMGHLDILKWLIAEGCPLDKMACFYASEFDKVEVIRWLQDNGCKCNRRYH